jgi:signal transduction histidine kinase/CHASE1-domain containing sensor protein
MGLLLSCGVALLFYLATSKSIEHDTGQRFTNLARIASQSLDARLKSYADLLRGTASVFQMAGDIDREQFHRYVSSLSLKEHFPAIATLNFIAYVTENERPAFERRLRQEDRGGADGYPPYRLKPPQHYASYLIVTLIEPIASTPERFGMNVGADPAVRQVILASMDQGAAINSSRPLLIPSKPDMIGLTMRMPVYRKNAVIDSVAQRRAAFVGSIGIGFDLGMLLQGALKDMSVEGVRLTLYDGGAAPGQPEHIIAHDKLITDIRTGTAPTAWWGASEDSLSFVSVSTIDYHGRTWKARFSVPKKRLYSGFDSYFPWLAMLAGFAGSMLIFALFQTLASSRRKAIRMAEAMTRELRESQVRLQQSHQKLRSLAAHAEQIKEDERKRIAREIHDDLGQNLLVLRIEVDMLATRTSYKHTRLHTRALATLRQIDATIKSVRQIINDLRPNVLDLGLNAAVEWQIAEFRRSTGIVCELDDCQTEIAVGDHCATAFFRILQESLSNISQHAQASLVQVELRKEGRNLSMRVRDNGIGMPMEGRGKPASFGLVGIEERMQILGGRLSISSIPGAGTTIHVLAPITHHSIDDPDATIFPHMARSR